MEKYLELKKLVEEFLELRKNINKCKITEKYVII